MIAKREYKRMEYPLGYRLPALQERAQVAARAVGRKYGPSVGRAADLIEEIQAERLRLDRSRETPEQRTARVRRELARQREALQ